MKVKEKKIIELPIISLTALEAIKIGVEEEHSISNLEQLGVKQRLINLLESNGITNLGHLMSYKKEDLLNLPNFGQKQLFTLFQCLSNYNKLS